MVLAMGLFDLSIGFNSSSLLTLKIPLGPPAIKAVFEGVNDTKSRYFCP